MTEPLPKPWTVEDFLEWEAQQPERYEFIDGRIIGKVGGSAAHAAIKDNVTGALNVRLRGGPCRAYSEGLKVVTPVASHYPDVVVTCKSIQPSDDRIHEPGVIVEIRSRTTADRDRGAKWVGYQDIASLQHYVLIAQDHRRIDLFSRAGDRWEICVVRAAADRVALPALGIELTLDEIYKDSGAMTGHVTVRPDARLMRLVFVRLHAAATGPPSHRAARGRPESRGELVHLISQLVLCGMSIAV